jgi:hypothetical protein
MAHDLLTPDDCYGVAVDSTLAIINLVSAGDLGNDSWVENMEATIEAFEASETNREVRSWLTKAAMSVWKVVKKLAKMVWGEAKAYAQYRGAAAVFGSDSEDREERSDENGDQSLDALVESVRGLDTRGLPEHRVPDPSEIRVPYVVFSDDFLHRAAGSSEADVSAGGATGPVVGKPSKSGKGSKGKKSGKGVGKRMIIYALLEAIHKRITKRSGSAKSAPTGTASPTAPTPAAVQPRPSVFSAPDQQSRFGTSIA